MRRILPALLLLAAASCGPHRHHDEDIAVRLARIPGMTVLEQTSSLPGYRFFELTLHQPADHADPAGPGFEQRMTFAFKDADAPTVMYTSGYGLSQQQYLVEPTQLVAGNQISVEHRFFAPSIPASPDWSTLTIEQSADDLHAIVADLKPLLHGRWLNTGASKGGMTAVFHRRFFPGDFDGTIAYVAPLSLAAPDPRYVDFVRNEQDQACTQALFDFERTFLLRRSAMTALLQQEESAQGISFTFLGEDRAMEHAVLEIPFTFWQYYDASLCPSIPVSGATDADVFAFVDQVTGFSSYDDDFVGTYMPYFFQAATQLGYPQIDETSVSDLLLHPGTDIAPTYVDPAIPVVYDSSAMPAVSSWLQSQGRSILFVYGQNDPWSAGAFTLGQAIDAYLYYAPAGNHGSRIADLVPADRNEAYQVIEAWSGVSPVPQRYRRELDVVEPRPPL